MVGVNQHSTYIKWWRLLWQVDMFIPLSQQNIDVEHYTVSSTATVRHVYREKEREEGALKMQDWKMMYQIANWQIATGPCLL